LLPIRTCGLFEIIIVTLQTFDRTGQKPTAATGPAEENINTFIPGVGMQTSEPVPAVRTISTSERAATVMDIIYSISLIKFDSY
jgi:hypothetical protein